MSAPLAGIRVVELASFVAAPAAGALLADLGAEVIKVEVPWGEIYRHSLPRFAGYATDFPLAPHFQMDNRGKRSVALDLALPEAVEALKVALWSEETADAHVALAEAYLELKDQPGARSEVDRALVLEPRHAAALALRQRLAGPG